VVPNGSILVEYCPLLLIIPLVTRVPLSVYISFPVDSASVELYILLIGISTDAVSGPAGPSRENDPVMRPFAYFENNLFDGGPITRAKYPFGNTL
jgi:hypothetical protein